MILGLGIDLFEVARLERELQLGEADFARTLFSPEEIAASAGRNRPARDLAARFAAKEAVVKALALDGGLGTPWRAIEILDTPAGPPAVRLHGPLAAAAAARGVRRIHVALAASRRLAAASAVAES